jgi:hypothetical protein
MQRRQWIVLQFPPWCTVSVDIGLSHWPASLCSLATQFQTRFLESIPRPIVGLKFSTQVPPWFTLYNVQQCLRLLVLFPCTRNVRAIPWFRNYDCVFNFLELVSRWVGLPFLLTLVIWSCISEGTSLGRQCLRPSLKKVLKVGYPHHTTPPFPCLSFNCC